MLMRLTVEEGSTVTAESMVVTCEVTVVAASSCSEGVSCADRAGRIWGVTEAYTASASSVAFASGVSMVRDEAMAEMAVDVGGFTGGHLAEGHGAHPAWREQGFRATGEPLVDDGSALGRRENGARRGGALAGDDRGDCGEGLFGVELVAAGCVPRQERRDVTLLGEGACARPVRRGLAGGGVDVDARVGGEGNVLGRGQGAHRGDRDLL